MIAAELYTPPAMHALMSAWMPAPPPLSLPAMASTRGTCGEGGGAGRGGAGQRVRRQQAGLPQVT